MTITIDPFLAGIIVGALTMLIVLAIFGGKKHKNKKKDPEKTSEQ